MIRGQHPGDGRQHEELLPEHTVFPRAFDEALSVSSALGHAASHQSDHDFNPTSCRRVEDAWRQRLGHLQRPMQPPEVAQYRRAEHRQLHRQALSEWRFLEVANSDLEYGGRIAVDEGEDRFHSLEIQPRLEVEGAIEKIPRSIQMEVGLLEVAASELEVGEARKPLELILRLRRPDRVREGHFGLVEAELKDQSAHEIAGDK